MKKILFVLLIGVSSYAQQEPTFNQYILESSVINPAYATSDNITSVGFSYLKNDDSNGGVAPKSYMLFGHIPISDRIETSFRVMNDDIGAGAINQKFIGLNLAYVMDVNSLSKFSFGLSVGANILSSDLSKIVLENGTILDDMAFQNIANNKVTPALGFGAMYYQKMFYVGFSIPSLIKTDNMFIDESKITVLKKSDKYLAAGYIYEYNRDIKLRPSILLRHNDNIIYPIGMFNALFYDRFEVGFAYNHDISNNVQTSFNISDALKISFNYQMYNKKVNPLFSTALEFGIVYRFLPDYYSRVINPRYY